MKKIDNKWMISAIIGIVFVIYTIVVFGLIGYSGRQFMVAYLFTMLAYVFFLFTVWSICGKNNRLKDIFLGLPVLVEGIFYVVIQMVLSIIFMIIPWKIFNVSIILQVIGIAVYAILVISSISAQNAVTNIDEKVRKKRNYLGALNVELKAVLLKENTPPVEKALSELAETVRFSDPMSAGELVVIEDEIMERFMLLENEYDTLTEAERLLQINEIKNKVLVRNMKCKMLK